MEDKKKELVPILAILIIIVVIIFSIFFLFQNNSTKSIPEDNKEIINNTEIDIKEIEKRLDELDINLDDILKELEF